MTTCTLQFHKKFHQQFIVCENLLQPVILGLDFSHNYLIGIDWLSANQLHLHQGSKSTVTLDPAPFPLHVNQIFTLPVPHILIKTVSQVTIPLRTIIANIPTTFNGIPQTSCHYSLIELLVQHELQQHLLAVTVLKLFGGRLPFCLLCTIINASSDKGVLPKTGTLVR